MRVMFLANYASHAVKGLMEGAERDSVMRATFETVGGRLGSLVFTRGAYDVVVTGEVPDHTAAMSMAMAVRASGSLTELCVLEELDLAGVVAGARKVAKAYKPAG